MPSQDQDLEQEYYRPLASGWLENVSLQGIDPEALVAREVDNGRVAARLPEDLPGPNSIFVFARKETTGDTRTYPFSEYGSLTFFAGS